MDFSRSEEQQTLYESVRDSAKKLLNSDVVQRDHDNVFSKALWKTCTDLGVLNWSMPAGHGGADYDIATTAYLMEALGEGCSDNGLTFALGAQLWSVQSALLHFGSQQQIETYLPALMNGSMMGCFAITEKGSGSDAFALSTTATRSGDHYILNGEKVMITLAPVANIALIFAVTNPSALQWGISAFLVDTATAGFIASDNVPKMGLRTVPFGNITLEDCRVSATQLLGKEGAGLSIFNHSQNRERALVLAPQLGAMQRLLDQCIEFSCNRSRADTPIGKHQAVSHRIADMRIRLETCRLLLYKVAWLLDHDQQCLTEAAIAKTHLSEAFVDTCNDAIAIHGGAGYITANGIERQARDATGATIYGGTGDIQRNIISGMLGL